MIGQDRYYLLGEEYWYFANKYNIVCKYLTKFCEGRSYRILDFGCGPGNFSIRLSEYGKTFGADISLDTLQFCKSRQHHCIFQIAQSSRIPIKDNSFDFVIALDVLEHIEDDRQIFSEWYRILKESGRIMLTVPAHQFLWGRHDELYSHKRRYQKSKIEKMIIESGFKVEKISYVYILFFIPLYLLRKIKLFFKIKYDDFVEVPPVLNKFLIWLNGLELHCLTKFNLPFGTSVFCIGKR